MADGSPHLIAITVDRNGTGRFYVDGDPAGTFNPTGRQGSLSNNVPLRFGRRSFGSAGWYGGLLDEFQLYKRVLTQTEIRSIFSLGTCKEYTRSQPQPPQACFTFTTIPIADIMQFDAGCTVDPDDNILSYSWDFGDGQTSTIGPVTFHFYLLSGFYTVTLTVEDEDGLTSTTTRTVPVF